MGGAGARCYGTHIAMDLNALGWSFLTSLRDICGWWESEDGSDGVGGSGNGSNPWDWSGYNDQLWIGHAGAVTPLHYDEFNGMLAQVRGTKRLHMWPPSQYHAMLAVPVAHPAARGSHVHDLDNISAEHAATFEAAAEGLLADVGPGEVLFIPNMWWHHVEHIDNEEVMRTVFSHPCLVKTLPAIPVGLTGCRET